VRDRAILATLLYHGMRREELCRLWVRDMQSREGVMHFRVKGKRDKIRFVPMHAMAQRLIEEYWRAPATVPMPPRVPSGEEQRDRRAQSPARSQLGLSQHRPEIWPGNGYQRRSKRSMCAFPARHGRLKLKSVVF
jgi:integrase